MIERNCSTTYLVNGIRTVDEQECVTCTCPVRDSMQKISRAKDLESKRQRDATRKKRRRKKEFEYSVDAACERSRGTCTEIDNINANGK